MVNCPILLKNKKGFTLVELLIIVTFLGIMAVIVASIINPKVQLGRSRDARRKSDLQKLRNPLEDYFNDHQCYPQSLSVLVSNDYISEVPKDPETHDEYEYFTNGCEKYWVYVKLENSKDQLIANVGCTNGCGPGSRYNYGMASGNTRLEEAAAVITLTPEATPTTPPGVSCYLCHGGSCISGDALRCSGCHNHFQDPDCGGGNPPPCTQVQNECP